MADTEEIELAMEESEKPKNDGILKQELVEAIREIGARGYHLGDIAEHVDYLIMKDQLEEACSSKGTTSPYELTWKAKIEDEKDKILEFLCKIMDIKPPEKQESDNDSSDSEKEDDEDDEKSAESTDSDDLYAERGYRKSDIRVQPVKVAPKIPMKKKPLPSRVQLASLPPPPKQVEERKEQAAIGPTEPKLLRTETGAIGKKCPGGLNLSGLSDLPQKIASGETIQLAGPSNESARLQGYKKSPLKELLPSNVSPAGKKVQFKKSSLNVPQVMAAAASPELALTGSEAAAVAQIDAALSFPYRCVSDSFKRSFKAPKRDLPNAITNGYPYIVPVCEDDHLYNGSVYTLFKKERPDYSIKTILTCTLHLQNRYKEHHGWKVNTSILDIMFGLPRVWVVGGGSVQMAQGEDNIIAYFNYNGNVFELRYAVENADTKPQVVLCLWRNLCGMLDGSAVEEIRDKLVQCKALPPYEKLVN